MTEQSKVTFVEMPRSKRLPPYHPYDGPMGIGLPFDHPIWDPIRRHAARRRLERRQLFGKFTRKELDRTFDEDYRKNLWQTAPGGKTPNVEKAKKSAEKLFKRVDLEERKRKLIDEFEQFLNKTNSDVPGRDELRDKIRDFKNEEKKHMLKDVTC